MWPAFAMLLTWMAHAEPPQEPPEQSTDSVSVSGALSKVSIDAVISGRIHSIQRCYQASLDKQPELSGRLTVKFRIEASGSVGYTSIKHNSIEDEETEACVLDLFRSMTFPRPDPVGFVLVTYPFIFTPDGAKRPTYVEGCVDKHRPERALFLKLSLRGGQAQPHIADLDPDVDEALLSCILRGAEEEARAATRQVSSTQVIEVPRWEPSVRVSVNSPLGSEASVEIHVVRHALEGPLAEPLARCVPDVDHMWPTAVSFRLTRSGVTDRVVVEPGSDPHTADCVANVVDGMVLDRRDVPFGGPMDVVVHWD